MVLLGTVIVGSYSVLKKFWTIEKDIVDLKARLDKQENNFKDVIMELKEELREIRDDIKKLLSRGNDKV